MVGTGFTPEGLDQNPAYFELIQQAPFRAAPVANVSAWAIERAHRRYALTEYSEPVAHAWGNLVFSSYSEDLGVSDETGVGLLPGKDLSHFDKDGRPTPKLCLTWQAWGLLLQAPASARALATYRYDVVNTARELLAQLSTPLSVAFVSALAAKPLDAATINATGTRYIQVLRDLDTLVATEPAFLLGSWLSSARAWGNGTDCTDTILGNLSCPDFMEWNARVQLTTWYPTPAHALIFGRSVACQKQERMKKKKKKKKKKKRKKKTMMMKMMMVMMLMMMVKR